MQTVFEKIIEKLEEELKLADREKERCARENPLQFDSAKGYAHGVGNAIEIVKQEAEQYNNGWIPCSERLPKENGYYYVTQIVKSVSTGKKIAIEKAYVEFSIGEWRRAKQLEVIAWLDIEPYQPKGEING